MRGSSLGCFVLLSAGCFTFLVGCASSGKTVTLGENVAMRADGKVTTKIGYDYWLYLPEGYDESDQDWPMILYLHGAGGRSDDPNDAKHNGIARRIDDGDGFPFIIVSPHCPKASWWKPDGLKVVVDDVLKHYRVDEDRLYLTGLSMGGTGTWMMAADYPDYWAAIAPVCGRTLPPRVAPLLDMPVWAFHGDADRVVDVWNSTHQIEVLKKAGNTKTKLTIYPGGGHGVWKETYDNPELYTWFLAQKRSDREETK